MIDGSEVMRSALADFGVTATVSGGRGDLAVLFADDRTSTGGDLLERMGPTALALSTAVALADLVVDDELTINGIDYLVVAIDPDATGVSTLALERL